MRYVYHIYVCCTVSYIEICTVQECMYVFYMFVLQVGKPQSENRLRICFFCCGGMFVQSSYVSSICKLRLNQKVCEAMLGLCCPSMLLYVALCHGHLWIIHKIPGLKVTQIKNRNDHSRLLLAFYPSEELKGNPALKCRVYSVTWLDVFATIVCNYQLESYIMG